MTCKTRAAYGAGATVLTLGGKLVKIERLGARRREDCYYRPFDWYHCLRRPKRMPQSMATASSAKIMHRSTRAS